MVRERWTWRCCAVIGRVIDKKRLSGVRKSVCSFASVIRDQCVLCPVCVVRVQHKGRERTRRLTRQRQHSETDAKHARMTMYQGTYVIFCTLGTLLQTFCYNNNRKLLLKHILCLCVSNSCKTFELTVEMGTFERLRRVGVMFNVSTL